jgi:hypothetical protein
LQALRDGSALKQLANEDIVLQHLDLKLQNLASETTRRLLQRLELLERRGNGGYHRGCGPQGR